MTSCIISCDVVDIGSEGSERYSQQQQQLVALVVHPSGDCFPVNSSIATQNFSSDFLIKMCSILSNPINHGY